MVELVAIHWEDPHFMASQVLVLLIMQYVIKIYSAISQISLLMSPCGLYCKEYTPKT